ncbi:MAG: EutN/CcmL family microcompartment protein [Acidobacteriota bacterium]|nr:EutN/CcmL family microcompartment protein [Acidobacteriota bacterium]
MYLARIEGSAVTTLHHKSLVGRKLLIARRCEPDGRLAAEPVLALDAVGAGLGDLVLISTDGELARSLTGHKTAPVRLTAVGIVDAVDGPKPGDIR